MMLITSYGSSGLSPQATAVPTAPASGCQTVPTTFTLEIKRTGDGRIISNPSGIDCGSTCRLVFDRGTQVTLSASPDRGMRFEGWGGDCSGTGTCILNIARDEAVTALFDRPIPSPDFNWFNSIFKIIHVGGIGDAKLQTDLLTAFLGKYSTLVSTGEVWVDATNGNDANPGTNTSPVRTLTQAVRNMTPTQVYVRGGTYEPFDHRFNEGNRAKVVTAVGPVVIAAPGTDISKVTWMLAPGTANIYQTQVSTVDPSAEVTRVLETDLQDAAGLPMPIPIRASLMDLDSSDRGWLFDPQTRLLFIRVGAQNIDLFKTNLKAVYGGSDVRSLFYGSHTFLDGDITYEGVAILATPYASMPSFFWARGLKVKYARVIADGSETYLEDVHSYRPESDAFGYHSSAGMEGKTVEYKVTTSLVGDFDTFGPQDFTQNGSSMHEGGSIVRINGVYENSGGPNVVDDGNGSLTSWNVATKAGNSLAVTNGTPSQSRSFFILGGTMWCDTTSAYGDNVAYFARVNGILRTFAVTGTPLVVDNSADSSGTHSAITPYDAANP